MKEFKQLVEDNRTIWRDGYTSAINTGFAKNIKVVERYDKDTTGLTIPVYTTLQIASSTIKLPYEALIPLFSLGGHEVRVLLFIIAYCADVEKGTFTWDNEVMEQYAYLYTSTTGKNVQPETVRQALITLAKHNVVQKQKRNEYVINPLYASKNNLFKIEQRINAFTKIFLEAGKSFYEALSFNIGYIRKKK